MAGIEAELVGDAAQKALRDVIAQLVGCASSAISAGCSQRLAILAPEAVQRPARQLFARIPLPLAEMRQSSGRKFVAQAHDKISAASLRLLGPKRRRVPLRAVRIVRPRRRSVRRPW